MRGGPEGEGGHLHIFGLLVMLDWGWFGMADILAFVTIGGIGGKARRS